MEGSWQRAAVAIRDQMLERARAQGGFSLRGGPTTSADVLSPGFMQGLSGIGYYLLVRPTDDDLTTLLV